MATRVRCGAARQPRARGGSAPAGGGPKLRLRAGAALWLGATALPQPRTQPREGRGEAGKRPRSPHGAARGGTARGGTSRLEPLKPGSWPSREGAGAERRTPTGRDGNVPVPPAVKGERLGGKRRAGSGAAQSIASHRTASHRLAGKARDQMPMKKGGSSHHRESCQPRRSPGRSPAARGVEPPSGVPLHPVRRGCDGRGRRARAGPPGVGRGRRRG